MSRTEDYLGDPRWKRVTELSAADCTECQHPQTAVPAAPCVRCGVVVSPRHHVRLLRGGLVTSQEVLVSDGPGRFVKQWETKSEPGAEISELVYGDNLRETVTRELRSALAAQEIPDGICLHCLRKSYWTPQPSPIDRALPGDRGSGSVLERAVDQIRREQNPEPEAPPTRPLSRDFLEAVAEFAACWRAQPKPRGPHWLTGYDSDTRIPLASRPSSNDHYPRITLLEVDRHGNLTGAALYNGELRTDRAAYDFHSGPDSVESEAIRAMAEHVAQWTTPR